MKVLKVDYTMMLTFSDKVTDHSFLLRCVPLSRGCQTVLSRTLDIEPSVPLTTYRDTFGNIAYRGECYAPHDSFSFASTALVQVQGEEGTREVCQPFYKYNTPLTLCTDRMKDFLHECFHAHTCKKAVQTKSLKRNDIQTCVEILREAVYKRITYTSGSTNVKTSAEEAFLGQHGVCQDYAHLFISLCRTTGIPARYVCGMSKGEGATHAWAEFFVPDEEYVRYDGTQLSGTWYGVDPTRNKWVDSDYVILAVGRDFCDCQIDRGVFCGSVTQKQNVLVKTNETDLPATVGEFSGHSVSSGANLDGQQ